MQGWICSLNEIKTPMPLTPVELLVWLTGKIMAYFPLKIMSYIYNKWKLPINILVMKVLF